MRLSVKLLFCFVFLLTAVLLFCAVANHVDIVAFKTKTFSTYDNCSNDKVGRPITRFETQIAHQNKSERSGTWHGQRSIPKIIHQIWNDEILPEEFVKSVKSLVRDNPPPEWNYYFWTKESGLKFIKDKYPYLYDKAKNAKHIMRSDILRILAIYEYGGVYFDLDTVSARPLDNFVKTHTCSLALEPGEHFFQVKGRDFLLSNAALLCVRRHQFFANIILHLSVVMKKSCFQPFMCTGPHMLSTLYRELNKTDKYSGELPDVQRSEVFQDVYDHKVQRKFLLPNCENTTKLLPYQKQICTNWASRGKENRNLSELSLTYHTWFHVTKLEDLHIKLSNDIKKVVPHVKIYGKDF